MPHERKNIGMIWFLIYKAKHWLLFEIIYLLQGLELYFIENIICEKEKIAIKINDLILTVVKLIKKIFLSDESYKIFSKIFFLLNLFH